MVQIQCQKLRFRLHIGISMILNRIFANEGFEKCLANGMSVILETNKSLKRISLIFFVNKRGVQVQEKLKKNETKRMPIALQRAPKVSN